MTLATGNTARAIALNASEVFYAAFDQRQLPAPAELSYAIRAVPKRGGPSREVSLSPDMVASIRANDRWVYWTTIDGSPRTGLYRAPVAGGPAELVFPGYRFSEIALDDTAAYFAHAPPQGERTGAVYALRHDGASAVALASGVTLWGWKSGLAVDASHVYFVDDPPPLDHEGTRDSAYIRRVAKAGGDDAVVLSCTDEYACGWFSLAVDDRNVYFRARGGGVGAVAKSGGDRAVITRAGTGWDLEVRDGVAWWNDDWASPRYDPDPAPRPGIRSAPVAGGAIRELDTGLSIGWASPRADAAYVFYLRGGDVVRRRR